MSGRPTALDALAADPPTAALVVDFDGVLSPIVEDPTTSEMPDQVVRVLGRLAKGIGLVAVMSGRPVDFLRCRVPVVGVPLLGSYGIEQVGRDGQRSMDPGARDWLDKVRHAGDALDKHFGAWPGIRVEKKSVSVAVHWRQADDQAAAADEVRRVGAAVAAETGLRLEPGKLVEELRPPIDVDKGSAISALLAEEKPATVAYAGDDLGDMPALLAVQALGGYALVVDHGAETDPRLLEIADQTFAGTGEFADWLTLLAARVGV
jgi:trehalose 6-phosphate phosphatase